MIHIEQVTKSFKDVSALSNVSFDVPRDQVAAIVGPNGAGKTTLFRLLSTLSTPDSGYAVMCDHNTSIAPQKVRAITGAVFTEPALYDRLTPKETLNYFGMLYGLGGPSLRKRIDELIEQLELGEFCSRLNGVLSRGMKQRVAIARAVLHEPSVLLLDEPTTGLDFHSADNMLRFLSEYRHGRCILFATHNFQEVSLLCNRLLVLGKGRLILDRELSEDSVGAEGVRSMVLEAIRGIDS